MPCDQVTTVRAAAVNADAVGKCSYLCFQQAVQGGKL